MTTPDQLADLLRRMEGAFGVTARIRRSPDEAFRTVTGNSTWTRERLGRYTHERFELTIDEQPLRGEVFFGPAASPGQFELVQVDAFNPGMIHVVGAWNEAEGRLVLERVISPKALRGVARPLRWSYRLGEGRSFVKEMHFRDGAGEWFLASDYHYRPASATRAPASTTPKKGAPEE